MAFVSALAAGGLALTYRFVKAADEITHNDVSGAIVATAGTVLAVMLSFMVVVVWQEYDASAGNVQREASAIADLHHLADDLPPALSLELHASIDQYVANIITVEWPAMRHGGRSQHARGMAYRIGHDLNSYKPTSPAQISLQQQGLDLFRSFSDLRRQRLADNEQGIPMIMWATMLFVVIVSIYLTYSFRVSNVRMHYIMTIALTAIIVSILVLIAELDYPFRGDTAITPDAFIYMSQSVHGLAGLTGPDY